MGGRKTQLTYPSSEEQGAEDMTNESQFVVSQRADRDEAKYTVASTTNVTT